ncbi:MAG: hypothetical protein Q9177_003603 [Variospora cf. flavescens]
MQALDGPAANYIDPNWEGAPWIPPVPPAHHPAKRQLQVVWPRDKKQKGPHTLGRFWDVLSGKGPDMWIGQRGLKGPTKPEWSRWDEGPKWGPFDNLGYRDNRDQQVPAWAPGQAARREKYNFKTRKYEVPRFGTWSDVKWDRKGQYPLYVRDRSGRHHMHPALPQDENNFVYDPYTSWWDWYRDELPLEFPPLEVYDVVGSFDPWRSDVEDIRF